MVFQQFNLFERRTALDNVKEGLVVVKKLSDQEATKIAKEELAKVGLSDRENHYPRIYQVDRSNGLPWRVLSL